MYLYGLLNNNFHHLLYFSYTEENLFFYPVGLIFKRDWSINDSFNTVIEKWIKNKKISKNKMSLLFKKYLSDIEWLRKRNYLMVLKQLDNISQLINNPFYKNFYQLDLFLRKKIS